MEYAGERAMSLESARRVLRIEAAAIDDALEHTQSAGAGGDHEPPKGFEQVIAKAL